MQPGVVYLILTVSVVAAFVAVGVFAYWAASRKRIAAETIGRAEEQAKGLLRDAEREAENGRKEALLEAKEKAHQIVMEGPSLRAAKAPGKTKGVAQTARIR